MVRIFNLPRSDEHIVKLVQNGDESILSYLYEKNRRMILKYITENNGSAYDATEYLQDALVIFWENVRNGKFKLSSKISTYLYGVVKNNWLRELARRGKLTDLSSLSSNPVTSEEKSDEEEELIEIIKTCMSRLSEMCRKILTLYYYENKSMDEISNLTGLANENVAKSKKYQCKKDLEFMIKKMYKKTEGR
jgi:RNA polymerase sigma factor (sigma-70 family)